MSSPERVAARPASLRAVAREAIEHGLREGRPPQLDASLYPPALREPRASFVTLRCGGELRGCTGTLEPREPLVVGVARNAWRSAFADPRFPPLAEGELEDVEISVSVLSPLEDLPARSRDELLAALRPGVDGLVLRDRAAASTFLPSVWESLPDPAAFLAALARKAGLAPDHWSPTLRFERYTADEAD
jgi:AmmeMemoRadiSam system protein A